MPFESPGRCEAPESALEAKGRLAYEKESSRQIPDVVIVSGNASIDPNFDWEVRIQWQKQLSSIVNPGEARVTRRKSFFLRRESILFTKTYVAIRQH